MDEATVVVERSAVEPSADAPEEAVVEDLLVADVSVDGMCGVYQDMIVDLERRGSAPGR